MMDFMDKCMMWMRGHVVFEHGAWYIIDNEGDMLDGPYNERYDDELEKDSLEYAVQYAEDWWDNAEEGEEDGDEGTDSAGDI